jgi:hypothetical protein
MEVPHSWPYTSPEEEAATVLALRVPQPQHAHFPWSNRAWRRIMAALGDVRYIDGWNRSGWLWWSTSARSHPTVVAAARAIGLDRATTLGVGALVELRVTPAAAWTRRLVTLQCDPVGVERIAVAPWLARSDSAWECVGMRILDPADAGEERMAEVRAEAAAVADRANCQL